MPINPIKHVVVLMLENNSFDRMLGCFHPRVRGVDPDNPWCNVDKDGERFTQEPTDEMIVDRDPLHEYVNVMRQIGLDLSEKSELYTPSLCSRAKRLTKAAWEIIVSWLLPKRPTPRVAYGSPYQGNFVLDFSESCPISSSAERQEIMGYYPKGSLYALHTLAEHFTICDYWFSSVPGPTWANRFFVHSGTSVGWVRMPQTQHDCGNMRLYDQKTIYDCLNKKGLSWKIFHDGFPQSLALVHQWQKQNKKCYAEMPQFYEAARNEKTFPSYSFIEPRYFEPGANDDHPPHDVRNGQVLIANVYNAIRGNESLWNSTLLVVLYDEHGGFFDHQKPQAAVCPDDYRIEYTFTNLGVRVPAVLVSPWVDQGVCSILFDHTSLLKYVIERWKLRGLTNRVSKATSICQAIRTTGAPRMNTPQSIQPQEGETVAHPSTNPPNGNQRALLALAQCLASLHRPTPIASRQVQAMAAGESVITQAQVDEGREQIRRFLQS